MADDETEKPRTHYRYKISLRINHPSISPKKITAMIGIEPTRSWEAGEARRTPKGKPLEGTYRATYWTSQIATGCYPREIDEAIRDALETLVPCRSHLHQIREGGGSVELFIGWFFENQCGDVIGYKTASLAGDLLVDLSFDIYSPDD